MYVINYFLEKKIIFFYIICIIGIFLQRNIFYFIYNEIITKFQRNKL